VWLLENLQNHKRGSLFLGRSCRKLDSKFRPLVQIVIPALNEQNSLKALLEEVRKYVDTILVVDGHSVDDTVGIAIRSGANVVIQRGKGKGAALRHAFELADADIIVVMDADGSMDPKEIPRYVSAILSGADFVKGSRFVPEGGSADITILRKIGNFLLTSVVNFLWETKYTDLCYGFFALRREALKKINKLLASDNFEIEAELCVLAQRLNLDVREVPSYEFRRSYGKSNLNTFVDGSRILRKILAI
jgi:glycosyltransferase involved in cell wall biosynthesis